MGINAEYMGPHYEQPQQDPYRPQHHEYKEPEQPADVPVVVGTVVHQGPPAGFVRTESVTPPPTQAPSRYPEYDYIEVITAPPLGGHRHYANSYEVQVGTYFNAIYSIGTVKSKQETFPVKNSHLIGCTADSM